ncbi:MAG: polysaccharide deacetylase [Schlesneria sp.]|nr:polysaccharide deacetylase [Schlesneria sp.]
MNLLRKTVKWLLTSCVPSRWLLTRGPRQTASKTPRIALTFDDGPHLEYTGKLLDILQANHLQATFFVVGKNAEQSPGLVQRIVAERHELGNHTWSHGEPSQTSPSLFLEEIRRTDEMLVELTDVVPQTVRPPKGELNLAKLRGLWKQGKNVALWNVDPRDYRMTSEAEVAAWVSTYEPQDGDVLLFHDNQPWASQIITQLAIRGTFNRFQTVSVSTLAGIIPRICSTGAAVASASS